MTEGYSKARADHPTNSKHRGVFVYYKNLKNFMAFGFIELAFTPCKAEQPLRGMELQEKADRLKHTGTLFRKNLQIKGVC